MIRAATLADIDQLYELAVSMVDQSNFMPYGVNRDKFNTFASALITHGFVAVFEKEGKLVGAMLADVIRPWYSDHLMGVEHAIYIKPEHRSGIAAARMIKQWIEWCRRRGAIECRAYIGTSDSSVGRLYQAMGFRLEHASYILSLKE